ncbi:11004_t:CDS:2 [Acaulospora colombiana]|uniref:11004_t:CDS:1 n=1 Tax=Acaulospora colombiana TaxID=27376 RepID=A0ACA9KDY7_9GLOM|nr:11004_t:CDS:2 [Acaulospora colombiana]
MVKYVRPKETYDFIIVGAGSAGCILARELIYNIPNINILILEAGPPDAQINDRISVPFAHSSLWRTSEVDWSFYTQRQVMPGSLDPTKTLVNQSLMYPRGKATENNNRKDSDDEFKKYHGFDGLIRVHDHGDKIFDVMKEVKVAAKNYGIPENKDYNGAKQNGIATYQAAIKNGKRCSVVDGYLTEALSKVEVVKSDKGSNDESPFDICKISAVNVKSHSHVLNVIWEGSDGNVAKGVRYFYDGAVHEAYIAPKGEVILSAGAINSIGPRNDLTKSNIMVRKELPVGKNLWDHPLGMITVKIGVPNSTLKSCIHHWSNGPEIAIFHKANSEGRIPTKDELSNERPDIQITCAPIIFDTAILNPPDGSQPFTGEGITFSPVLNLPASVGWLELASQNPFEQPKIFLNYFDKSDDMYRMISSFKMCLEIIKNPPLSTVWNAQDIGITDEFGQWASDGVNMTDDDWERYIREKHFTSFHPCGTVKMAPEERGGVVDHRLRVYGTRNLRVVDASIFPNIPAANTFAPVCMTAWRASRLIEEDYKRK